MKIKILMPVLLAIITACSTTGNNNNNANNNIDNGSSIPTDIQRNPLAFYTDILEGELQEGLLTVPLPGNALRTTTVFRTEIDDQRNLGLSFADRVAITPSVVNDTVEDLIITSVGSDVFYSIKSVTTRRGRTPANPNQVEWNNDIIFKQYGNLLATPFNNSGAVFLDENGDNYVVPEGFTPLLFDYRTGFSIEANQNNSSSLGNVGTSVINRDFLAFVSSNQDGLQIIATRQPVPNVPRYIVSGIVRTYKPIVPVVEEEAFELERTELATLAGVLSGEVQTQIATRPLRAGVTRGSAVYRREVSPNGIFASFQRSSLVEQINTLDNIPDQQTYTNDLVEELVYTQNGDDEFLTLRNIITRRGFVAGVFPRKIWSNDTVFLGARDIYFRDELINSASVRVGLLNLNTELREEIPAGFRLVDMHQFNITSRTNINQGNTLSAFSSPVNDINSTTARNYRLVRITEDEIQLYNQVLTLLNRPIGGSTHTLIILNGTQVVTYTRVR